MTSYNKSKIKKVTIKHKAKQETLDGSRLEVKITKNGKNLEVEVFDR